jgi:hypothetical protein
MRVQQVQALARCTARKIGQAARAGGFPRVSAMVSKP